uniref:T-cell receptor alpha/delta variable 23.3.8 n=1 Tax=Sinocyclocheilus grahami TaxID=75366 RepID=A0A672Q1F0_SINGR
VKMVGKLSDKGTEKNSQEGENVKLSCSHRPSTNPQFILCKNVRSASDADSSDPRFQSTASRTSTELTITDVHLSDSALYYCALRVGAQ